MVQNLDGLSLEQKAGKYHKTTLPLCQQETRFGARDTTGWSLTREATRRFLAQNSNSKIQNGPIMLNTSPFRLEALVDFPDDALAAGQPLTPAHLDAMMARLAACGVRRVSWATYGDGHGGYFIPSGLDAQWAQYAETLRILENPLRVAVEAGHRHGIEVYGYFKPYETGAALVFPDGSPEARTYGRLWQVGGYLTWLDPFVVNHPDLRIRRRTGDLRPGVEHAPVCAIRLAKQDDSPTRLTGERLQIWTSPQNYRYRRADVSFQTREAIEPAPADVYDVDGNIVTRKDAPVRTLTLSGFTLEDPYILITTDFKDGSGDFKNTGLALMTAFDAQGREIPGVFASGAAIWEGDRVDFRSWGLIFDMGWTRQTVCLDTPNDGASEKVGYGAGRSGLIAFSRGRNEYLPGALCEADPDVQAFWLSWVDEMIAAGVDGVDMRVENHSTHTDYPEEYGFNPVVLDLAERRNPNNPYATVPEVRGDAYTAFLREAKRRIHSAGKRMRINLNVDFFRPDPPASRLPAYPLNIRFDWMRWVEEGLLDEAILRFFHLPFDGIFDDSVARAMCDACSRKHIPVVVNRYVNDRYEEEFDQITQSGRFDGFILYETAVFLKLEETGWQMTSVPVEKVCRKMSRT